MQQVVIVNESDKDLWINDDYNGDGGKLLHIAGSLYIRVYRCLKVKDLYYTNVYSTSKSVGNDGYITSNKSHSSLSSARDAATKLATTLKKALIYD